MNGEIWMCRKTNRTIEIRKNKQTNNKLMAMPNTLKITIYINCLN